MTLPTNIDTDKDPLGALRRRRGPGCVSDQTLDQHLLEELPAEARTAVVAHLAVCTTCSDQYAALAADRQRFLQQAPVASLAVDALSRWEARGRTSGDPTWGSRLAAAVRRLAFPLAGLCAGAAVLGLWVTHRGGPSDQERERTKGGFSLSAYVLHPERADRGALHLGEPLHPGDKLQFHYNGDRAGYLGVVGIDATGKVSVYYPGGPTLAPVEAARDLALPSAVELDGTMGPEAIVAVRCAKPLAVAEMTRAAQQAADAARARGAAPSDLGKLPLDCDETRQAIVKARP